MQPMMSVLSGQRRSPPPVWLMRQAGRYLPEYRALRGQADGFVDFCLRPELAAEATLQPIRRFGLDAAILFADILLVPMLVGYDVRFAEGEGPRLSPGKGRSDIVEKVAGTVSRVRAALPEAVTLIGFAGAPWTVAAYCLEGHGSRDFATAKTVMFAEPDRFQDLIDRIVEATIEYLVAQVRAGAQVVKLFDTWAGMLPETAFRRHVIEATGKIVAGVKERVDVPVIGFPRGAGLLYRDYVEGTGVDAVALDPTIPLEHAKTLQELVPVQGNLDPIALLAGGSAMEAEIDRILAALGEGPFIFNLGHGILPATPPSHVAALVDRLRRPI